MSFLLQENRVSQEKQYTADVAYIAFAEAKNVFRENDGKDRYARGAENIFYANGDSGAGIREYQVS